MTHHFGTPTPTWWLILWWLITSRHVENSITSYLALKIFLRFLPGEKSINLSTHNAPSVCPRRAYVPVVSSRLVSSSIGISQQSTPAQGAPKGQHLPENGRGPEALRWASSQHRSVQPPLHLLQASRKPPPISLLVIASKVDKAFLFCYDRVFYSKISYLK